MSIQEFIRIENVLPLKRHETLNRHICFKKIEPISFAFKSLNYGVFFFFVFYLNLCFNEQPVRVVHFGWIENLVDCRWLRRFVQ